MSSLLAALANGGNALRQFEKAVSLTQSDVVNASTPGYAAQQIRFESTPFAPASGLYGGVQVGGIESTRDDFAESAVRRQTSRSGYFTQVSETLATVEGVFDVGADGGISNNMQALFNSFSAWSQQPNDTNTRQRVIEAAQNIAVSFRQAAGQIQDTATESLAQARTMVAKVNDIGKQLAQINQAIRQSGGSNDSETEIYAKLEQLSEVTGFTISRASDNTVTVLLGDHIPLVIGDHSYQILASATPASTLGSPAEIKITDVSGQDVTNQLDNGKLGGLINSVNTEIATLLGGDGTTGTLNDLATAFATRINDLLQSGTTASGNPGLPLFTVTNDGSAAATLAVTDITADDLAIADPGPPPSANGIAVKLAGLASSSDPADLVHGETYLDYCGQITSAVGAASSDGQSNKSRYSQLASQARSLRSEMSGVSLDEEAVRLVEFQRAYEATARTITTLNQMMDTLMQLGQ